jgi:LPXTG-motif cell wall-anchored protein
MELLAQDRPALITEAGEGDGGPFPPGAENVATLLEIVGISIFLALLAGAIVILIRRRRNP